MTYCRADIGGRLLGALMGLAVVAAPGAAWAACSQSDLTGKWRVFTINLGSTRCLLVVDGEGVVTGGRCKGGVKGALREGSRLEVNKGCVVTGKILGRNFFGDNTSIVIQDAQLEKVNRTMFSGIGKIRPTSNGFPPGDLMLSGVKK